ncbi:hypothetical protein DCS_06970 [Drechmeria coniospora]|uniref:Uncharacterized protein n=1 Tax=Drechmeria coniospora TaxID=98403 RepID=A0A151GD28_DRECN|nr:hypothetical protein DCS_06970 [Drechmeria coniospora]KYK55009.1 hypothetical protein DCS_06970 [Drechmeria coniospora]
MAGNPADHCRAVPRHVRPCPGSLVVVHPLCVSDNVRLEAPKARPGAPAADHESSGLDLASSPKDGPLPGAHALVWCAG